MYMGGSVLVDFIENLLCLFFVVVVEIGLLSVDKNGEGKDRRLKKQLQIGD